MKIVVLSPHRDDAAFSLGLSIESWLAARQTVHVLNCFTQSNYAPYSDAESLHPNDRASFASAVRKREDAAWAKLFGGGLKLSDLDLLDAPLRLICGVDEAFTSEIRAGDRAVARVAGAIAKVVRTTAAGELAIALPLGIGGHIDHRVTRQAGLETLSRLAVPVAFYEDLPYAARPGAAEGLAGAAESTGLDLRPVFASEPAAEITLTVARKRRMAECYDSQIDSVAAAEIAGFAQQYGGRERLWGNGAWRASSLVADAERETPA